MALKPRPRPVSPSTVKAKRAKSAEREHIEQSVFVFSFRRKYPQHKRRLYAVPNGGARHAVVAQKLKLEGVMAGVPDIFLRLAAGGFHGLYIEMKAKEREREGQKALSEDQALFFQEAANDGYACALCFGDEQAMDVAERYLAGQWTQSNQETTTHA